MDLRPTYRSPTPPHWLVDPDWTSRLGSWLSSTLRAGPPEPPEQRRGKRRRTEALAAARLEFAEALFDVHTMAAGEALDRIAVCRSLAELWHLREAVFSHIARRHDQGEAERRLSELDRHFVHRGSGAAQPPRQPLRYPV